MASSHETAVEALRTTLAGVVAGVEGAAYTPSAVERVVFFPDQVALDPSLTTIYLIRPGEEREQVIDAYTVGVLLEIFILVAGRFTEPTENPHQSDPKRWQITADLVRDVTRHVEANNRLGGAVIDACRGGWVTDYERYLPTWALAEIRMVMHFHRQVRGR